MLMEVNKQQLKSKSSHKMRPQLNKLKQMKENVLQIKRKSRRGKLKLLQLKLMHNPLNNLK